MRMSLRRPTDQPDLLVAIELPPFDRWRLLTHVNECPGGWAVIARLATGKRGAVVDQVAQPRPDLPPELEPLLAAFARMSAAQRVQLLQFADELLREALRLAVGAE